jgi:hypothetical protein
MYQSFLEQRLICNKEFMLYLFYSYLLDISLLINENNSCIIEIREEISGIRRDLCIIF